jgi:hypothetical protein
VLVPTTSGTVREVFATEWQVDSQLIPEPQRVGSRIHVCGASVVNGLAQLDGLSGLRGVLRSSRSNTSDQRYTTRLPRLMNFGPVPR